MKRIKLITLLLCITILSSSCLGSFSAFNGLKDWNHTISDNKFVNNLVFWALNIVPVYGLFFVGDAIIFNVIEFWSGTNPLAMNEGDIETQTLVKEGNTYEMIATKNKMTINVIDGKDAGNSLEMFYKPEEKTWYAKKQDGEIIKLSSMKDGFYMVYLPNGQEIQMSPYTTQEEGLAIIQSGMMNCDGKYFAAVE